MTTALALILTLAFAAQDAAEATPIDVRRTSGCCLAWMEHLRKNGFAPTGQDMFAGLLVRFKLDNGVPQRMISCHTALVDGYAVEGHVPAIDIRRLLEDRPGHCSAGDATRLARNGSAPRRRSL